MGVPVAYAAPCVGMSDDRAAYAACVVDVGSPPEGQGSDTGGTSQDSVPEGADPASWEPAPAAPVDPYKWLGPAPRGGTAPAAGAPAQPTLPTTLTAREVQSFAPSTTAFTLEPNGWAVVGGHVNAYATASRQTSQASIVGIPVTVTFEPVEYRWSWGDGTTLTTETGGASWREQGLADWSPTVTSHVYGERGERTASLQIAYRASVQAQGRTIPVQGLVVGQAATASVLVVESDRALVATNCLEDPRAPGC